MGGPFFFTHTLNPATGLYDRRRWFKRLPRRVRLWLIEVDSWLVGRWR